MSTRITEFGLRAFPPEILELIFTPLLTFTGKTPPLLVALRADPQLYQEALSTFRKLNTFKLHRGNKWMTGDMNPSAIQSIRALTVDFWSSEDWEEWDYAQVIEPNTHCFPSHPILSPANSDIRTLHLNVSPLSEFNMSASVLPAVACASALPALHTITVSLPRITYHRYNDDYDLSGLVRDLVDEFNFYLGVKGKLMTVGGGAETGDMMRWFWTTKGVGKGKGGSLGESSRRAREAWEKAPGPRDAGLWNRCARRVVDIVRVVDSESCEHEVVTRRDTRNIR